jgi:hypothetical protein
MKIVWTIVALLLLGGLIVLFQPAADTRRDAMSDSESIAQIPTPVVAPSPAPSVAPVVPQPVAPSVAPSTAPSSAPSSAQASAKPQPSTEPTRPPAEVIAAGAQFEPEIPFIANAEIIPSKFIKLADGAISVDDAWTIRGEGTAENPYEVSWEFLSSAQEDYMPRLGEKKLPARIAFLSGKRVKIGGYLAFPLVAPTSSECLLMLNQWDGCCIGIPPTPYDAVEVKLADSVKGWKRHTINFGSIEGTFKVEPYLVENWLVGLYMIEDAKLDTGI